MTEWGTAWLGRRLQHLPAASSTQDVAAALAADGAEHGTVVLADEQSGGRGRLGRAYFSPPGGLWCSIVLRPGWPATCLPLLILASGLAVAQAIHGTCALTPRLKWPNDVLLGDRKVSGAMAEARLEGVLIRGVVLGIGINANIPAGAWPPELRESATSLLLAAGRPVALPQLTRHLLQALERHCDELTRGDSATIVQAWRSWPNTLGQAVSVGPADAPLEGIAEDIGDDGSLRLRLPNSDLRVVAAGDVSLRLRG